jgi:hypothetical protein
LVEARAINDAGQITGVGTSGGPLRAFLLSPAASAPEAPVITEVRRSGADVLVSFTTIAGANYTLLGRGELTGGAWEDRVAGISGTGGTVTVTDAWTPGSPQRYYRVRLNAP